MVTNKDYTIKDFMGYGEITIPKGTRVSHETAMGIDENYHFVNEYGWIREKYPTVANILLHDVYYHGINVPKEYINK